MKITIVTTKGQIVIPVKIRQRLNIQKGTKIYIEERENELILRPLSPKYLEKVSGVLQTKRKLSRALLKERG